MRIIYIELKECEQCPYHKYHNIQFSQCEKTGKTLQCSSNDDDGFPSFCPLIKKNKN